jgi:hypothetical protein
MPIKVVHGNYGSFENAQGNLQAGAELASVISDAKNRKMREQAYLDEVRQADERLRLSERELDIQAARYGSQRESDALGAEAGKLGADAQKVAQGGMGALPSDLGVGATLNAVFGVPPSELGLEPGKDYEQVINEHAVRLLNDPQLSTTARRQLASDLATAQKLEIERADHMELAGQAEDMIRRFGQSAGEEWLQDAQEALKDAQEGGFSNKREGQKVLRELRREAEMIEKRQVAGQALMQQQAAIDDDDAYMEIQKDIRTAKTPQQLDGVIADIQVRGSLLPHQYEALRAKIAHDEQMKVIGPDPYPEQSADPRLSGMSPGDEAVIREANGMGPKQEPMTNDRTPSQGSRSLAALPAGEQAKIADRVRTMIEQLRLYGATDQQVIQRVQALLTGLDVAATPDDVVGLLRTGNEKYTEAQREAVKNRPPTEVRKALGGVRN